jgi:phosphoglycolate phosphatase-like HAD superfamily hydrolase
MIGDNAKDIACGLRAGCGATILVRTGNSLEAQRDLAEQGIQPTAVADNLLDAAGMILSGKISLRP